MAINIVEKNALALNQILRTDGKRLGKAWRLRIRTLLGETFAALNAKPLDGALCLQLSEKIEAELAALSEMKGDAVEEDGLRGTDAPSAEKPSKKKKSRKRSEAEATEPQSAEAEATEPQSVEADAGDASDAWWAQDAEGALPKKKKPGKKSGVSERADADGASGTFSEDARMSAPEGRIGEADSPGDMPRIGGADSGEEAARIGGADSAEARENEVPAEAEARGAEGVEAERVEAESVPEEAGLFDLIHVQIRCFFKINACVRPPYIGKFVQFADKFSEVKEARIERFIRVLSKGDEEISMKTEVEVGYRDDLIPDMPEMGFVLHPKKKKKR
ncbi:MAG: hypothetical protein IJ268_00510 [Proteobacteria bacterium]|nr:hypothetical protein [Pseudomonadota bacterium]